MTAMTAVRLRQGIYRRRPRTGRHGGDRWLRRPFLPDPFDDHILEVAVAAKCDAIITYNKRDFRGVEKFNPQVLDARELLFEIGEIS